MPRELKDCVYNKCAIIIDKVSSSFNHSISKQLTFQRSSRAFPRKGNTRATKLVVVNNQWFPTNQESQSSVSVSSFITLNSFPRYKMHRRCHADLMIFLFTTHNMIDASSWLRCHQLFGEILASNLASTNFLSQKATVRFLKRRPAPLSKITAIDAHMCRFSSSEPSTFLQIHNDSQLMQIWKFIRDGANIRYATLKSH